MSTLHSRLLLMAESISLFCPDATGNHPRTVTPVVKLASADAEGSVQAQSGV